MLLLSLLFLAGIQNDAAGQASPPAATTAAPIVVKGKADPLERVRCESTIPTGSSIPKRTCKTEREWAEAKERAQRSLDKIRRELEGNQNAKRRSQGLSRP